MSWLTFWKRDSAKSLSTTRTAPLDGFYPLSLREHGRTDTAALQDMMSENELVFACLDIRATAATDPRLIVQRRVTRRDGSGKTEWEEVVNHPMARLMANPNRLMSEGDLMRAAMISWDTTTPRRFYAEKEYKNGLLVGIWPLNPAQMSPRYSQDESRRLIGYRWSDGSGRYVDYTLDELIIREAPSWYRPAPGVAATGSARADQAQTDYAWSFFENGGMPSIYVKDEERTLNQAQRDDFRARWKSTYGNRRGGQHEVGVLDRTQSVQKVGANLDELDNDTLRQTTESRICMVYGVPPLIVYAYVGLVRATYSNLKEAWASFWDFTMSPALKDWRTFWQRTLLPEFEDAAAIGVRVRLWWDMSGVAAVQEDADKIELRAATSYQKGLRTRNEARALVSLPPVPDGDTFYTKPAPTMKPAEDDEEEVDDGR